MQIPETTLRFSAAPEDGWLYDCHAQRFAPVEHGASMATGFEPLFSSQLFGIPVAEWPRAMAEVQRELRSLPSDARAEVD